MIAFLKHSLIFLSPFFLLFLLGGTYDPSEGGLTSMAYLPSLRKYSSKPTELNHVADLKIDGHSQIHKKYTGQPSVAIFGDSFLPGLQSNLIIKNISTFNIHHYKVKNPFVLSLSLTDSLLRIHPDYIIIESIERALLGRLNGINSSQSSQTESLDVLTATKPVAFNFMEQTQNGLFRLAAIFNLKITGSQKRVHHWEAENLPLHDPNTLYTISTDRDNRKAKYNNVNLLLIKAYQKIQEAFPQSEIQFLIIPDKLTFYQKYLTSPPCNPSILNDIDWTQPFFQIQLIPELEEARENGLLDLYKYSGTHFGGNGNEIGSRAISEFLHSEFY